MGKLTDSSITVALIVKNNETHLHDCLKSVKDLATEIVILDSGSTDKTLEIAKQYTDKVYTNTDWQGFGKQRQLAQSYATGTWIFMLDADERLTPALIAEVKKCISQSVIVGYYVPRKNYFLNKEIRFGGGTDYVLRLYKNDCGKCDDSEVHEKIQVTGKTGKLKNNLIHYSTQNINFALYKMNMYSELGSDKLQRKNKTSTLVGAIVHGLWTFMRTYILQLGFLDGQPGFILAVMKAEGSYYKYVKLIFNKK